METQAANLGTQNPSRIKRDNQVEPDQLHRQYSVLSVGKGRHSAEGEEPAPKRIRENCECFDCEPLPLLSSSKPLIRFSRSTSQCQRRRRGAIRAYPNEPEIPE